MSLHIFITGASSGIGKAAAEALARSGFIVFGSALNDAEAQRMLIQGIPNLVPVVLDVTSMASIEAAVGQIRATLGPQGFLSGFVNCAGVDYNAPLHIHTQREIEQMIGVNYTGCIMLTRAVLPLLRDGQSRLVFITSAMAVLSTPTISVYCSTKSGVEGFADALRVELIPAGIKVSIIEPGVIRTPMVKHAPAMFDDMLTRMTATDRSRYEGVMRRIVELSSGPKAGTTTDATTAAITHALTATKPKIRYQVGADSKAASIIGNLPYRVQDWIQRKIYGI